MTEAEVRAALAAFDGLGGLERWIAGQQPREAVMGGSTVPGDFQGWRFRLELEAFRDACLSVAQAVEPPRRSGLA